MTERYIGLDYGMGLSNVDRESGFHYGVIPMNSLYEWAWDHVEPDYGSPHCPKCGNDTIDFSSYRDGEFDFDAECGIYQCERCLDVWYPMECDLDPDLFIDNPRRCPTCKGEVVAVEFERREYASDNDYLCLPCHYIIDSSEAYSEDPLGWDSADDGYILHVDSDAIDMWILKSPWFTYAQYCAPTAPGAGYLKNHCTPESGAPRTYALGAEWFDKDNPCPYPIWSVETGELIYTPATDETDEDNEV